MALREVARVLEAPTFRAEEERFRHVEGERQSPHEPLSPPVEGRRGDEEADADGRASREAEHRLPESGILLARDQEQTDLGEADDAVRAGEEQRVVPERSRHAEGDDQRAAIATNITSRTPPSSGSRTLVSQA